MPVCALCLLVDASPRFDCVYRDMTLVRRGGGRVNRNFLMLQLCNTEAQHDDRLHWSAAAAQSCLHMDVKKSYDCSVGEMLQCAPLGFHAKFVSDLVHGFSELTYAAAEFNA